MRKRILSDEGLDLLFREARTHSSWRDEPVSPILLQAAYDLAKMGPTSANCCPLRVVFVVSPQAKEMLKPALSSGNVEKTMRAPATAILAYDSQFHEHLGELFPHEDAKAWFEGKPKLIERTAFRNGTLQAAYFILAARSLGLDCGPMSGFSNAKVDEAFFPGGRVKSNFLCNLGYGDHAALHPRLPRFDFERVCRIE